MTQTTKKIFEKYQVRKTKEQKTAFIDYVKQIAEENGYEVKVEKGRLGARNIVVGNSDTAKVLYTAHYDTCSRLPFPNFITPKCFLLYLLYQFFIATVLVAIMLLSLVAIGTFISIIAQIISPEILNNNLFRYILVATEEIVFLLLFLLFFCGPANKNTANDNTSGVTTLIDIICEIPDNHKQKVAFVFFDLEESGLLGSAGFVSKHKKNLKDKLVINFDCVSDGENILFAVKKKAKKFVPLLEETFNNTKEVNVEIALKGVFYPSDNMKFSCGVGVAALKKSKLFGVLYMDRIHTKKDTIYRKENIEYLKSHSIKLLENI